MKDAHVWSHENFWAVELPDLRLRRRLFETAACIRENPCGTLPRAMKNSAATKGAYRLLDHPEVTHEKVLSAHVEKTRLACREAGSYLLIEDTTALSFSHRGKDIPGMGYMSNEGCQGLFVHNCLAARVHHWSRSHEPEVSLAGLFGQEYWARETPVGTPKERKKAKRKSVNRDVPVESDRWGRVLRETEPPPQDAQWTMVADRESDIFEVMRDCGARGIDWVIRASQARKTLPLDQSIFDAVKEAPVLGSYSFSLRARPGVAARKARVRVRALNVAIRPKPGFRSRYKPLETGLVEVSEVNAPKGVTPVHWLLLTSWPCATFKQARRVAGAYSARWLVEEYHKALKTGTKILDTQLCTADRIAPLIAIHAVVAVELLQLKLLTRVSPDEPIERDTIAPESIIVLEKKYGPPDGGWTNQKLMRTIARLGGHLGRKSDGPPGWLSIWRGWQQLSLMTQGYILATQ